VALNDFTSMAFRAFQQLSPMKIVHLAPIKGLLEKINGSVKEVKLAPEGISASVPNLAESQYRAGNEVGLISSFASARPVSEDIYWSSLENYSLFAILSNGPYKKFIKDFGTPDLLNIHDIYNLKQIIFSLHFFIHGVKVFVTPRGTFSEVALRRSKFKKIFFLLVYKIYVRFIYAFVALNEGESKQIKKVFPKKKIIIIGNGVDYNEERNNKLSNFFKTKVQHTLINIGFLGRFDIHIKGLDLLLNGYLEYQKKVDKIKIKISLLGEHRVREWDSKKFISEVKSKLPHPELLEVSGPYYGFSKWEELAKLDLLIQPSRTEGMPNTVLEAMSSGVPCVVTPNTNVAEMILEANAGWRIEATEKSILDFLLDIQTCDKTELLQLGKNAKKYTKENLTWDNIGKSSYL